MLPSAMRTCASITAYHCVAGADLQLDDVELFHRRRGACLLQHWCAIFLVGYLLLFQCPGRRLGRVEAVLLLGATYCDGCTQFWWNEKCPIFAVFPRVILTVPARLSWERAPCHLLRADRVLAGLQLLSAGVHLVGVHRRGDRVGLGA